MENNCAFSTRFKESDDGTLSDSLSETSGIAQYSFSDRPFYIPRLGDVDDPVEVYIERLSDSKRLTLLKYFIFRQKSQQSSYRWLRRPGKLIPIAGEHEVTNAYQKVLIDVVESLSPGDRYLVNKTLDDREETREYYEDLDRSIAVLTAAIEKSEKIQDELKEVIQLETGFPTTDKSLFAPKDLLYFHIFDVSTSRSIIINPIPYTPWTAVSLIRPRFALPPQCRNSIPITRRLTNDLLYLISESYNEQWSALQALVEMLLFSFLTIVTMYFLSSWSLVFLLFMGFIWVFHLQLANERRWVALDLACEDVNRLIGRLGVTFHPQQIGCSLCINIEFRQFDDVIRTKDLFVLKGAEIIQEFEEYEQQKLRLPIEPVVPGLIVCRKGHNSNLFGKNVGTGGRFDDKKKMQMEWKEWLEDPSNVIEKRKSQ